VKRSVLGLVSVFALVVALPTQAHALMGWTSLVSKSPGGQPGDYASTWPCMSSDGRFIAFQSIARNLVAGDTNGVEDVFVSDIASGTVTVASVGQSGARSNARSVHASISRNGRYVTFSTEASNLVPGDLNGLNDVYVRDLLGGTTRRASVSIEVTPTLDSSYNGSTSDDGRFVVFDSQADNLIEDDDNNVGDVFVRDMVTETNELVSVPAGGGQGDGWSHAPSMSADGRYIAFVSYSTNLVNDAGGAGIFLRDRVLGTTTRVDVSPSGAPDNGYAYGARISADGSTVAYYSTGDNVIARDANSNYDIFVRDLVAKTTTCASLSLSGATGNSQSADPDISADGRYVTFSSHSSDLVLGDTNNRSDVFIRDRLVGTIKRLSVHSDGSQAFGITQDRVPVDSSGQRVAFTALGSTYGVSQANTHIMMRDLGVAAVSPSVASCVVQPTAATLSAYGASYTVRGDSYSGQGALAGVPVALEVSNDGQTFSTTSVATTTATDGSFAFTVKPSSTTYYRVKLLPMDAWSGSPADTIKVTPRAYVRTPIAPSTMSKSKYYTVYGYLKPRHKSGTYPVRLYKWKRTSSGSWKSYGYVSARASDYTSGGYTYTKYSRSIRLPYAGKWKVRAYATADSGHAAAWSSGYDYVTVK